MASLTTATKDSCPSRTLPTSHIINRNIGDVGDEKMSDPHGKQDEDLPGETADLADGGCAGPQLGHTSRLRY